MPFVSGRRALMKAKPSTQMAASYVGIMLMPSVFGLLADAFGAKWFPVYVLALALIMIFFHFSVSRALKRAKTLDSGEKKV